MKQGGKLSNLPPRAAKPGGWRQHPWFSLWRGTKKSGLTKIS